jgi:hypothetical protein
MMAARKLAVEARKNRPLQEWNTHDFFREQQKRLKYYTR